MHLPLISVIFLTEAHLLPSSSISSIPTTYQIFRNDTEIDKLSSTLSQKRVYLSGTTEF